MKNLTVTVVCAFGALICFLTITPAALTWYADLVDKHPEMWNPKTDSELSAAIYITAGAFAAAFLPVFTFLGLAFSAAKKGDEVAAPRQIGRLPGHMIPVRPGPLVAPAMGPAWPKTKIEPPPPANQPTTPKVPWFKRIFSKK